MSQFKMMNDVGQFFPDAKSLRLGQSQKPVTQFRVCSDAALGVEAQL